MKEQEKVEENKNFRQNKINSVKVFKKQDIKETIRQQRFPLQQKA